MTKIDQLFADLKSRGRKAFMPFITAGDPDLDFTAALIRELAARGASLCEVGFPYSDPIADGPVIQASYTRSLANKIKVADILDTLGRVSPQVKTPLVGMISYAIIYRMGPERFLEHAKQAGLAGAIVPDLPFDEAAGLAEVCRRAEFSLIQLVSPSTPRDRAVKIAEMSTGFLYYVSVMGITGERQQLPQELLDNVAWLREQTTTPICIGFGISRPEHVRLLAPVADGLIVGSAIVRRVAEMGSKSREVVLREIGEYVRELVGAMEVDAASRRV